MYIHMRLHMGVCVHRYFEPKPSLIARVLQFTTEFREGAVISRREIAASLNVSVLVGVHIRRGDKVWFDAEISCALHTHHARRMAHAAWYMAPPTPPHPIRQGV